MSEDSKPNDSGSESGKAKSAALELTCAIDTIRQHLNGIPLSSLMITVSRPFYETLSKHHEPGSIGQVCRHPHSNEVRFYGIELHVSETTPFDYVISHVIQTRYGKGTGE